MLSNPHLAILLLFLHFYYASVLVYMYYGQAFIKGNYIALWVQFISCT